MERDQKNPLAVTEDEDTSSFTVNVGDQGVCRILGRSLIWLPFGQTRYDATYRHHVEAAFRLW